MDEYSEIRKRALEGESQRKIAKDLGISRKTVKKYCDGAAVPWEKTSRERDATVLTKEVVAFIESCLDEDVRDNLKKQKHTARRIYDRLVEEKGFTGGESTIRRKVREIKERRTKSFIPLQFEPGEAMQVDWGEASVEIGGEKKKIYFFCARLCYSCRPFVVAYSHQNEESFLEAYVRTFTYFGGVPKKVIFDNAKVAVKEGSGAHAKKQEGYFKLCAHYGFSGEFCNAASGHEKGLVEGLVGYARRNIMVPMPKEKSLEELNAKLAEQCGKYDKRHIPGKPATVGDMFEMEKAALRPLPTYPFETAKSQNARVSLFSTVRFQTNEYSVPTQYVGRQVGIKGYPERVSIIYEGKEIADHERLWGKNQRSCRLVDYLDLLEERGRAILNAVPVKQTLSPEAYEELKANIQDRRKVMEILRREASLPPETEPSAEEPVQAKAVVKNDPVKIKKVNLQAYDTLMQWGERAANERNGHS